MSDNSQSSRQFRSKGIASPDGALSFLFGIFAVLIWYMSLSPSHDPAILLSVGITWNILALGTLAASLINMIRGKTRGNMNLLVTILLGFVPGINTLVSLGAIVLNRVYHPVVIGLMYMIGSIFCLAVAWMRWHQPVYIWLRTIFLGLALLFLGAGDVISIQWLMAIGGWNMLAFALLSFYFGLSQMYPAYGSHLPQGPDLEDLLHGKQNRSAGK